MKIDRWFRLGAVAAAVLAGACCWALAPLGLGLGAALGAFAERLRPFLIPAAGLLVTAPLYAGWRLERGCCDGRGKK